MNVGVVLNDPALWAAQSEARDTLLRLAGACVGGGDICIHVTVESSCSGQA